MSLLGLPPISTALKSITPYLQRAHELNKQDPVVAYWCAYYAAQVGISLKAKDPASRDVLFALLSTLERMKKSIGSSDALDIESVSSAYVENFALKVFAMADNEDRTGNSTRSTAKKFLAAANFLEVLKTFPKSEISDSNGDKIKYAKWKAADIAKAFREGRKPVSGPAGSNPEQDLDLTPPASPHPSTTIPSTTRRSSPPRSSGSGSPKRGSPPTHVEIPRANQAPFVSQPQTPPRGAGNHLDVNLQGHTRLGGWGGEGEVTPGSWSTAATPGTGQGTGVEWGDQASPTRATIRGHKPRSGSGSSIGSGGSGGSNGKGRKAWVSEELDPHAANHHPVAHGQDKIRPDSAGTNSSDGSKKSVHFTPSVVGGLSDSSVSGSSAPTSPSYDEREHGGGGWPIASSSTTSTFEEGPPFVPQRNGNVDLSILPPGFVPDPHQGWPVAPPTTRISPPSQPHDNTFYAPPHAPAPNPPSNLGHQIYAQNTPSQHYPSPPPPPVFDLTPGIIAKAQKHCRFAISALDYEDSEQAKKELRAALAILGG